LPNLKPGWQGAHMYKKYQIWPLVRNWAQAEFDQIPASIRPYLGEPVNEPSPIQRVLDPLQQRGAHPKVNTLKVTPFKLTQAERFIGGSFNPYRQ